jgi:hypothetical protein
LRVEKPFRAEHTYTQLINASPEIVFPLLCPVREVEWAKGWMPRLVISETGAAEEGCIFTTREAGAEATWIITHHDHAEGTIGFVKVLPEAVVTEIRIRLKDSGARRTEAIVTYRYTAISEEGQAYVSERTPEWYERFMRDWESELNAYLRSRESSSHERGSG